MDETGSQKDAAHLVMVDHLGKSGIRAAWSQIEGLTLRSGSILRGRSRRTQVR